MRQFWVDFDYLRVSRACPTLQSSKCGHTNHLVSVSVIVGTESVGGKVPVGKARRAGSDLPPACSTWTLAERKAGSLEFRTGSTVLNVGVGCLLLDFLVFCVKKCVLGAESSIYITPEPTECRTQNIKDTEQGVVSSPWQRLLQWESIRKANVQLFFPSTQPLQNTGVFRKVCRNLNND